MDEFLSPVPAQARKLPLLAEDALDEAEASIHSSGGNLVFQWLNFRILSSENARALSQNVLKGQVVEKLKNRVNASESFKCYDRLGDNTGKSAVRCDVGVGFSIHHPIVNVPGKRMMSQRQGNLIYRGLRTWHARFLKSKGMCFYDQSM